MHKSQIVLEAMGDAVLAAELLKAMCQPSLPEEPPFLPAYTPGYHEPSLGTLWPTTCHIYLVAVKANEDLFHFPESSLLQERVQLTRALLSEEVRRQFNLAADSKQDFAVCKGFQLCLVAEETCAV